MPPGQRTVSAGATIWLENLGGAGDAQSPARDKRAKFSRQTSLSQSIRRYQQHQHQQRLALLLWC